MAYNMVAGMALFVGPAIRVPHAVLCRLPAITPHQMSSRLVWRAHGIGHRVRGGRGAHGAHCTKRMASCNEARDSSETLTGTADNAITYSYDFVSSQISN